MAHHHQSRNGAQVFASEAVSCPALLLSCLAGLQLPLACLLLIINSVLLYAACTFYSLRVWSARTRTVVPDRAPHDTSTSACCGGGGLLWCWARSVFGGALMHWCCVPHSTAERQPQPQRPALTANSAASAAVQRSAAQHRRWCSTKCGTGQRRVRSAAPRRVCSSHPIGGDP